MLILTSPAKTLDYEKPFQAPYQTQPSFLKQSAELVEVLKGMSVPQLEKLMSVSTEIADVNVKRFQIWQPKHTMENSRPAIVAYSGRIYEQIHENSYTEQQSSYLQESLRIVSGLYGILKPYDLIQPYRLEMNIPLANSKGKDLYVFWKDLLTQNLNHEIEQRSEACVISLASLEYLSAVDVKSLKAPLISIVFNQQKKGKIHSFGLLNRKARGMMIDFMVKNRVYDIKQLETFDTEGYQFMEKTPNSLLFMKVM